MDALRLRRRYRPPVSPEHTISPKSSSPSLSQGSELRKWPFILVFVQFVVILSLIWFLTSSSSDVVVARNATSLSIPAEVGKTDDDTNVHYDCFVTIYAYDRPRQLFALLSDIARESESSNLRIGVNVVDDNSYGCAFDPVNKNIFESAELNSADFNLVRVPLESPTSLPCVARHRFLHVEELLRKHKWNMYVAKYRHARRRYWNLVRMAHKLLKPINSDFYLFLPDDDRLATRFFDKAFGLWRGLTDTKKLTMMLHVEETREREPQWTSFKPRSIGGGLQRIGWVESGNFLCTENFLQFVNWSFPQVPVRRWIANPAISSGVGSTLSELIYGAGFRMFRSQKSYVAHVGVALSKMNADFRQKNTGFLMTKYFADGDDQYKALLEEAATVTVSIATQWTRETALHSSVRSLAPQVDHMNVYLNGYDSVPSFLMAPYITVKRSQDQTSKGDIGDIGKFFWCNELSSEFHLTADDDIFYPSDYVEKLLLFWHSFKTPIVAGVHGIRIKQDDLSPSSGRRGKGYYGSREVWMATEKVKRPVNVHIIGTGTMLYRPHDVGTLDLDEVFKQSNMADIWFGLLTQKLKLPMMIIPHDSGWIREVPGTFEDSIYKKSTRSRHADRYQTNAAKSIPTWTLYPAKTKNS